MTERYHKKSDKLAVRYKVFLFALNIFLLYLVLNFDILLAIAMIFIAASLLSILIKLKFRKGNSGESFQLHDRINLIYKHIKINRKYIILSIVGLVVASLILSHSIILDASYTQISFEGYIENKDDTALNILIDKLPTKEDLNHWESIIESKENSLPSEYNLELDNYYITSSFEVRVSYGDPVLIVEQDYSGHLWDYYQPHIIVDQLDLDEDFLNKLKKLPTFTYEGEYNSSTNILIVPRVKNINFTEMVVNDVDLCMLSQEIVLVYIITH